MDRFADAFRQIRDYALDTRKLSTTQALLEWDQQTYMPSQGGDYRAEQVSYLAGLIHRRTVDPRVADWLAVLSAAPQARDRHTSIGASVFQWQRQFEKQKKLSAKLVEELAKACSLGQMVWGEARRKSDFGMFAPALERIVKLKREQAEAWRTEGELYDGLLDEYEPLAKTAEIREVLERLRVALVPMIRQVTQAPQKPDPAVLHRSFPRNEQERLVRNIAAMIGFDFSRGRLDTTRHPFCTSLGPNDCRITTRYDETYFSSSFFGTLHEAGHGLYEQGLPAEEYGLPSGDFCSLGMHESQSRLWENLVARSRGFWSFAFPQLQQAFPQATADLTSQTWYAAVNHVRPNLIRVEADEATYNLHIVIRFELEQDLLSGRLDVGTLPAAWNDAYEKYLGIRPERDADGVLQDIHWSAGLFGYFPTYSLGNIYASQLAELAAKELGGWDSMFARGEFRPLLEWLRQKIHLQGNRMTSREMIQQVGGAGVDCQPLLNHLRGKLLPLYGLA